MYAYVCVCVYVCMTVIIMACVLGTVQSTVDIYSIRHLNILVRAYRERGHASNGVIYIIILDPDDD